MAIDATGIGEAASAAKSILGMFFDDKSADMQAKIEHAAALLDMQAKADQAQIAANAAASAPQAGMTFRDGAGWTCVIGLGVTILKPLVEWGSALIGHPLTLPAVDTSMTTSMLMGLLGLGAMHMNETIKTQ